MTEADPAILVASSLDPIISITSISTSDAKIEKFRNKAVINYDSFKTKTDLSKLIYIE